MRKHQDGFTLLELVMVIVILGALAAVAIPRFVALSKDAERASVEYELKNLNTALNLYVVKQMASGQPITTHNPFDDISTTNYAGAFADVDSTNCPPGYWAYQGGDPALNGNWVVIVYRTKSTLAQAFSWGGIQWIILQESVVQDSNGKVIGLALTDYPPVHQW